MQRPASKGEYSARNVHIHRYARIPSFRLSARNKHSASITPSVHQFAWRFQLTAAIFGGLSRVPVLSLLGAYQSMQARSRARCSRQQYTPHTPSCVSARRHQRRRLGRHARHRHRRHHAHTPLPGRSKGHTHRRRFSTDWRSSESSNDQPNHGPHDTAQAPDGCHTRTPLPEQENRPERPGSESRGGINVGRLVRRGALRASPPHLPSCRQKGSDWSNARRPRRTCRT